MSAAGVPTSPTVPTFQPVARDAWTGRDSFYRDYVQPSRPVVFTGAARKWPCMKRWTTEYLCKAGRGIEVEVACGACEETSHGNIRRRKLRTTLDTFVASVSARRSRYSAGPTTTGITPTPNSAKANIERSRRRRNRQRKRTRSSDRKPTSLDTTTATKNGGNNTDSAISSLSSSDDVDSSSHSSASSSRLTAIDGKVTSIPDSAYLKQCEIGAFAKLPMLRADVRPESMFSEWAIFGCCNLWIGDDGATKTGLHNDDEHNVLCQIRGRKRVILISPDERDYVYPNTLYDSGTECCDVDASHPDLQQHPLFARICVRYEVTLEAGDVLFIPRFWYHEVNPVGNFSVSINYFCSTPLDQLRWGARRALFSCLHRCGLYKRGKCVCCDDS